MSFRSAPTGRRSLTIGVLAVALAISGCHADRSRTAAEAAGWHPVSAPPGRLPSGPALWVADELVFLSPVGDPSFAYRPRRDTWRSVAPPPRTDEQAGWTMVSTGGQIVAVTRTATIAYTPTSDSWRSLTAPPASRLFVPPDVWSATLTWTGREVAMAQPLGDDVVALDVLRGRWRTLPRTGVGGDDRHRLFATTAGLISVVSDDFTVPSPVHLLRPGADQWRRLSDLPTGPARIVFTGSTLFVAGSRPGTEDFERGRYLVPDGRWEPLPPSPVSRTGGVSVADGGLVALWYGIASEWPERPNGVLLRPGSGTWEAVPPPPGRFREGGLVAAGKDFLLLGRLADDPSSQLPVARFRPPSSPGPSPPALPSPESVGLCRASTVTAARGHSGTVRGAYYEVTLTNRSEEPCTLTGPVELTATNVDGAPLSFPGSRSADPGPALVALPAFERGATLIVEMRYGDMRSPPGVRPECVDAPIARRLFVTWPGADGTVEIAPRPDERNQYRICNVEVSSFVDPWPTW